MKKITKFSKNINDIFNLKKSLINDNKIKIQSSNLNEQDKIKSIIFHKFKRKVNYLYHYFKKIDVN